MESLVQNMYFSFPDISNSATEKFFPVLILDCLVNILFMLLRLIININQVLLELDDEADGLVLEDKHWLSNVKIFLRCLF